MERTVPSVFLPTPFGSELEPRLIGIVGFTDKPALRSEHLPISETTAVPSRFSYSCLYLERDWERCMPSV